MRKRYKRPVLNDLPARIISSPPLGAPKLPSGLPRVEVLLRISSPGDSAQALEAVFGMPGISAAGRFMTSRRSGQSIVFCFLSLGAVAGLVSGWLFLAFLLTLIVLAIFLKRQLR